MKNTLIASLLVGTFLLSACGNKGPLTLPPAKLADHTSPTVPNAPAAPK